MSPSSSEVRKMTGMYGSELSALTAAMNSKPSMCGMLTSEMMRSGGWRRTRRAAASGDADGKPGAAHSGLNGAPDRGLERARWPLLVALSACAFLQYFYMNVFLSIDSVRSLIVFVLVNGALPPV